MIAARRRRFAIAACGVFKFLAATRSPASAEPEPPAGLAAWSGYHRSIRLTWFPVSGASAGPEDDRTGWSWDGPGALRGELPAPDSSWRLPSGNSAGESPASPTAAVSYRVERASDPEGPYLPIASALSVSWYRDDGVENGRPYYYRVVARVGDEDSAPTEPVEATAEQAGFLIGSAFTESAPLLDGRIRAAEWAAATVVEITASSSASALPVTAYLMNSATEFFIAVRDPNFPFPDAFNQIGIYFDENHDGAWNAPPARPEGNIWILYDYKFDETSNWFRALRGTWPYGVTALQFGDVTTVRQRMSFRSGQAEFEVAIDLTRFPRVAQPGQTIGFGLYSDQDGNAPFTGDWPGGIFSDALYFKAPVLYGDLVLGSRIVTPVRLDDSDEELVAFPNPTRGGVSFRIGSAGANGGDARLRQRGGDPAHVVLLDLSGRLVARLPWSSPGVAWDGRAGNGARPAPGVYFFRLEGSFARPGRLVLNR